MARYIQGLGYQSESPTAALTNVVSPGLGKFTVVGGFILIRGIVGICTIACGGANTVGLALDPADASGANTLLCTATDIGTTSTAGDVSVLVGAPGTPLLGAHTPHGVVGSTIGMGILCAPGIIGVIGSAANGSYRWIMWWLPVDVGARVTII